MASPSVRSHTHPLFSVKSIIIISCTYRHNQSDRPHRKKYIMIVAPSMWKNNLNLHTQGIPSGSLASGEQYGSLFTLSSFVGIHSHHVSYEEICATPRSNRNTQMDVLLVNDSNAQLPSFEEVHCSTIQHIPAKSRPAFAKTLSSTLQDNLHTNNEIAWLKLFLLPKCVLVSSKRIGCHHRPPSINYLCDLWSKGHLLTLWEQLLNTNHPKHTRPIPKILTTTSSQPLGMQGMGYIWQGLPSFELFRNCSQQ